MSNKPLVTVITPTYNRADYLVETIESVLTQDYPNFEYIVLDDGSKDNTIEVLEQYTGRVIWESHPNMGETRTVNKGFSMAKGEYIVIVNSDDPILPGLLSEAVAVMEAHPDVLVAYPDWIMIDKDSQEMERFNTPDYHYITMLRTHFCNPGPGAFIRRRALELEGGRDPEFRFVADYDLWLRLGLHAPFIRIPKYLATFRVHPGSATQSAKGKQMADEHVRMLEKLYSRPDLPREVLAIKSEAMSTAYMVAGQILVDSQAVDLARPYYFNSMIRFPRFFLRRTLHERVSIVRAALPPAAYDGLLWIYRRLRSVKRFAKRLVKPA
ncbi:MAG: glycosyltransferase family 2 protein [Anaerolineae bacterium]